MTPTEKPCTKCNRILPMEDFGMRGDGSRYEDGALKRLPWCRECRRAHDSSKWGQRARRERRARSVQNGMRY